MQNNYSIKANLFQVKNNINVSVTINNYFSSCTENEQEEVASDEREQEGIFYSDSDVYWDMAEDEEENINSEKEKYLPSKLKALKLERIYYYLNEFSKVESVHNCGTYLEFLLKKGDTINKKKLKKLNSCKLRLCPFCAWRKSLRIFSNVRKCIDYIEQNEKNINHNNKSRFLIMTLTVRNCYGVELKNTIDNMFTAFNKFIRYKEFKLAFLGFFRSLEITVDREPFITRQMYFNRKIYYDNLGLKIGDRNPNYLTFHPHFHLLLHTTNNKYFGDRSVNNSSVYLDQVNNNDVSKLWQKALKVDYLPQTDLRVFKAKNRDTKGKEIAEFAKYAVKPVDYLKSNYFDDFEHFDDVFFIDSDIVKYLDYSLFNRHLIQFNGTLRNIYRKLKLDSKMSDDIENEAEEYILKYYFSFKNKIYKRIK